MSYWDRVPPEETGMNENALKVVLIILVLGMIVAMVAS